MTQHSRSDAMIQVQLPSWLLSIAVGHGSVFGNVAQSSGCAITYIFVSQSAASYVTSATVADLRAVIVLLPLSQSAVVRFCHCLSNIDWSL